MKAITNLARIAYTAYCKSCGYVSVRGDILPDWDELPLRMKANWEYTVLAVRKQLLRDMTESVVGGEEPDYAA